MDYKTFRFFQKRDLSVAVLGLVLMQAIACILMNKFMFFPVKGGYDKSLPGYIEIGTSEMPVAGRILGPAKGKGVILYCHGNAEDITAVDERFYELTCDGYTVATFDYPGYGLSAGNPTEEGCYANAGKMFDWLVNKCGFKSEDIFVVGYSIGTGVAIEIATKHKVGGLWLESAYLSAPRIVTKVRMLFADPFQNVRKIKNVKCPIVMLHGTDDNIIPYAHGLELYNYANEPKKFISIKGGDHVNFINVMGSDKYRYYLLKFMQGQQNNKD